MEIKKKISLLKDEIISLRRDFHAYPELGWNEFKTSEKIVKYLENIGLDVKEVARPGVVGLLKGKKEGPTLMMRADMDALPIQEMNEISYKSLNNGVMHACGHDGHMAMQLVSAKILSEYKEELEGNIKFVFQPNEETAEGAKEMIKEGVLENPKVDAAIGMHLWSQLDSGLVGLKTGAVMASLAYLKVKVTGKGGHTGYPEQAIDPIIAAADIVQKIQILQTREKSQLDPTIIVFGKITGGSKNNIIPESVELEGTIRKLELIENQSNYNLEKRLKELLFSFEQSHRVRIDLDLNQKNKMVMNDHVLTANVKTSVRKIVGEDKIINFACTASEDFSEFSSRLPAVFIFLGCGKKEPQERVSHHNCYFEINEEMLPLGVEIQVRSALDFFKKGL